jgi:hypothetical protein
MVIGWKPTGVRILLLLAIVTMLQITIAVFVIIKFLFGKNLLSSPTDSVHIKFVR